MISASVASAARRLLLVGLVVLAALVALQAARPRSFLDDLEDFMEGEHDNMKPSETAHDAAIALEEVLQEGIERLPPIDVEAVVASAQDAVAAAAEDLESFEEANHEALAPEVTAHEWEEITLEQEEAAR